MKRYLQYDSGVRLLTIKINNFIEKDTYNVADQDISGKVKRIRKSFRSFSELVQRVNDIFGWHILFIFGNVVAALLRVIAEEILIPQPLLMRILVFLYVLMNLVSGGYV